MDRNQNIALGYALSSFTIYPSVGIMGRYMADARSTMTQGSLNVGAGPASLMGSDRFGDYASLAVDPVDNCTFWLSQGYSRDPRAAGGTGPHAW